MSKVTSRLLNALPGRFSDLAQMYPPHAIEDDADYESTVQIVEALLKLRRRTKGQEHYLETLSQLIEVYDETHYADELGGLTPIEALVALLESNQMNASDLGEFLGNRSLGSKLLRGERDLSQTHIRKLSKRFAVDPGIFFGS